MFCFLFTYSTIPYRAVHSVQYRTLCSRIEYNHESFYDNKNSHLWTTYFTFFTFFHFFIHFACVELYFPNPNYLQITTHRHTAILHHHPPSSTIIHSPTNNVATRSLLLPTRPFPSPILFTNHHPQLCQPPVALDTNASAAGAAVTSTLVNL